MARSRPELQARLEEIMRETIQNGNPHVYYQPPGTQRLEYPCILFDLKTIRPRYADDEKYTLDKAYTLTVIERDPDAPLAERLLMERYCDFDRRFEHDHLIHTTLTLYY